MRETWGNNNSNDARKAERYRMKKVYVVCVNIIVVSKRAETMMIYVEEQWEISSPYRVRLYRACSRQGRGVSRITLPRPPCHRSVTIPSCTYRHPRGETRQIHKTFIGNDVSSRREAPARFVCSYDSLHNTKNSASTPIEMKQADQQMFTTNKPMANAHNKEVTTWGRQNATTPVVMRIQPVWERVSSSRQPRLYYLVKVSARQRIVQKVTVVIVAKSIGHKIVS